ncbi:MAG: CehA/McbA family metallohydrolase [Lachnospiraceae bacterium]|nr:CehA/McbA family metallohydrolase [Lachnospiraceae bacterium]
MEKRENKRYHVISACENTDDLDFTNITNKRQAKMLCADGEVFPALVGDIPYVKGQVSFFSTPRFLIDLTGWNPDDAWLHFFFYVSDPTAFTGYCQFELSSSGRCDVEEANWNSLGTLHEGWNEYLLSFRDASVSGGVFDMSRVNWFRFYYYMTKDVTVGISRLEIVTVPKAGFLTSVDTVLRAGEALSLPTTAGTVRASSFVLTLGLGETAEGTELALTLTDGKNRAASRTVSLPANGEALSLPLDTFDAAPGFSFPEITGVTLKALNGEAGIGSVGLCGIETAVEREIKALLSRAPITPENADSLVPAVLAAKERVKRTFVAVSAVEHRTANVWLPSYMAFCELSKAAEEYAAAEGGVWISPAEPAADGSLAVTLKNRTGSVLSGLKLTVSALRLVLGAELPAASVPALAPEGTVTLVLPLRPVTGGVCKGILSVRDGEKTLGSVSRFLRFPGEGWYSGDLHTHSVRSDGKGTPAMNFYAAWTRGDSFLYMTDHNQKIGAKEDMKEGVSVLRANGINGFEPLKGCEITVYGPSGHALAYNAGTDRVAPPTGRTEADIAGWNEIFTDLKKSGGLTFLAHPFCRWFNFPGMTTGVMADYRGDWLNEGWLKVRDGVFYTVSDAIPLYHDFHGVEIMNFDCFRNEKHYYLDPCLEYWDRMNLLGEGKFFGSCGTDAHDPADIARCRNRFLLPAPTPFFVNDALGNGSFYPSSGPLLRFTMTAPDGTETGMGGTAIAKEGEKRTLRIAAESDGSPITQVSLIRCRITPGYENNLAAYESRAVTGLLDPASAPVPYFETEIPVTVAPGEFYRVEVLTEEFNEQAYSNPIWVSAGASRFAVRDDLRLLTLRPGESAMLFFDTDDLYDSTRLTASSEAIAVYGYGKLEVSPDALPGDHTVTVRTLSGKTDTVRVKVIE